MKIEYFLVLAAAFIIPFIYSFSRKLDFYKYPLKILFALGIPFSVFMVWDWGAVLRGHWSFNEKYITGFKIINLPVEEILFFIVVPFCALFTWEVVKYFMRKTG
jgi:lycopene cyclase domain-containing protein